MPIFKATFYPEPGEEDKCVLIADNKKHAIEILSKKITNKNLSSSKEPISKNKYTLEEVDYKNGIIYTGYHCC